MSDNIRPITQIEQQQQPEELAGARVRRRQPVAAAERAARNSRSCSVKRLLVLHMSRQRASSVQHSEQIGPE